MNEEEPQGEPIDDDARNRPEDDVVDEDGEDLDGEDLGEEDLGEEDLDQADDEDEDEPEDEPAPSAPRGVADGSWAHPIVSPTAAFVLASLSAILCPIGFVGIGVWPVAFVAWVPLILALRGQTPKRALWLSWYAGFVMVFVGFYWLVSMLETFSGFPLPLCVLFASVLVAQMSGRIALCGWLYARAAQRGWHHGLSFLGAFAVSELVYPLLFPWYYGASLHDVPILIQTADIGGPILVSLVVVAFNLAVAELFVKRLFGRTPDRRTLALGAAAPLVALAYGGWRIRAVDAVVESSPAAKIGMVQGNMPLKRRTDALAVHLARTEELRRKGAELVVWSEVGSSSSFSSDGYETNARQRITNKLRVPTVVGVIIREPVEDREPSGRRFRYLNTALMADESGKIVGRYDKQFLLMFGEYLPLGETFPILYKWSPNSGQFTPGTSLEPLPFRDHRLATMICYEDIIPSFVNKLVAAGDPDLLVNMTNDAWFGDTTEPWQHLALAKFRSVEHRLFLVRVTNSGVSALVDPVGRVLVQSETFVQQALMGEARFVRLKTIYGKLGDIPWWIVGGLMGLAAFIRRKR